MCNISVSFVFIYTRSLCIFRFVRLSERKYAVKKNVRSSLFVSVSVITYLLSLREHHDTHLRAACANLLAKLTQTTVRLLNISTPISSLSSSFPNQCSLTSTDSQDSSRLGSSFRLSFFNVRVFSSSPFEDIQLGILAEVLATFRSCLNDKNARVAHISLSALRTLLPVLFQNSHALTLIGLELLEDALQHTSSTYALTKVKRLERRKQQRSTNFFRSRWLN